MQKIRQFLRVFFLGFVLIAFTACGPGGQKSNEKNAGEPKSEISAELQKEQSELLAKANKELAEINQKIRTLNDKIKEKEGKLTDAQNEAIDEFETKRANVNKCLHQIKNISGEGWDDFKTTFEKDLEEVKAKIDEILAGL